jgi:putative acetyltransferase
VLQRLEGEARLWGEPLLRLETGIHQHEAIGLYERSGFSRCPPFGHYLAKPAQSIETSVFYEKPL